MSLRALVVGLGQIGMGYDLNHSPHQFVMTHARALMAHPDFTLVGGVDSDPTRITLFESEYGCPASKDLVSALKNLKPDIVIVATPTATHYRIILTVITECKPKAIICEKPIAYNINEATEIVNSCEEASIDLFVNYFRRSDRGVIDIKRRIDHDLISHPIRGVCWYSKGLLNSGSHFLNLLQYWLGEVINFELINKGRLWNNEDPEPDVEINFELGTVIFLAACEEHFSHYTIELISPMGRLEYAQGGSHIVWHSVIDDPICEGYRILNRSSENILSDLDRIQLQVLDQLISHFNGQESFICPSREALETLKILDNIRNSL